MKLTDVINDLGADEVIRIAESIARELGIDWDDGSGISDTIGYHQFVEAN